MLDFRRGAGDTQGVARVVIEHLNKAFRGPDGELVRALNDASLTVEDKELLVLVGPSGCGKTTTLRLIAGLDEPDAGSISLDGRAVNRVPPKDRDVAMVFQNHALYPHLSAFENMALGLKLRRCPKIEIAQRVREAASILELKDCLNRKPTELSGGQRQRVALGRAIVRRPKVFLFDEPLSNLDAPMRIQMRTELSALHRRLDATMIYVTHDQVEAMALGDRIAVMKEGVIQQVAAPLTLYRQPVNLFVAGFIGSPQMNFFRGSLVRQDDALWFRGQASEGTDSSDGIFLRLEADLAARIDNYAGKPVLFGIRPEHIVEAHADKASPAQPVEATIQILEFAGPEAYLHLNTSSHSYIARVRADCGAQPDQRISVAFDMRAAHFFDPVTGKAI